MNAISRYILIDPFNAVSSGVSTYTAAVAAHLCSLGVATTVIARAHEEALPVFRGRVAREVAAVAGPGLMVEAPESLHATSELPDETPLHIRLHGSRLFGNWLQGRAVDAVALAAEQREISRAALLSAPSQAAVAASRHLFRYPVSVCCYPNPLPEIVASRQAEDVDLLFLGRWQPLKGIAFFAHLVSVLPAYRFAVACAERPPGLPAGVGHFTADSPAERHQVLQRSRAVVVPSLFETASMVGLEALAAGRPVISWAHLGLVEYANAPCLQQARAWSVDSLAAAARQALNGASPEEFQAVTDGIRHGFAAALTRLVRDGVTDRSTMPHPVLTTDWPGIFTHMTRQKMKADRFHVLKRKLRKLLRDPLGFWRDSFLGQLLQSWHREPLMLVAGGHSAGLSMPPEHLPSPGCKPEPAVVVVRAESEAVVLRPDAAWLGALSRQGKISLKDPADTPKGWVTALVHDEQDSVEVSGLKAALNAQDDFAPLRSKSLGRILSEIDADEPVISILNRIDVKNKERIARINTLVLINTPANVVRALRCCGPQQRILLVLTDSVSETLTLAPADTDAVICPVWHPAAAMSDWRRRNVTVTREQLPGLIRKVLQETGPKNPDMLLPLIAGNTYDSSLAAFDVRRHQGIIRLASAQVQQVSSLHEYIVKMAPLVREMLVLDSVYMRYRSLCEAVEAGESPAPLIEACLQDGVLFDVR